MEELYGDLSMKNQEIEELKKEMKLLKIVQSRWLNPS